MKELSIEEKAKAYDEALKVLHKYDGANIMFSQSLKEEMFPELKESEGEKIRKALIRFHKSTIDIDGIKGADVIAWLEKQGEQKYTQRDIDNAYLKGIADVKREVEKIDEQTKKMKKEIAEFIFNSKEDIKQRYEWIKCLGFDVKFSNEEKQDKQKPKFRVGDTIKCKHDDRQFTIKSVDLDKGTYTYTQEGCGNDIDYADEMFELVEHNPVDKVEPKFKVGDWLIYNRPSRNPDICLVTEITDELCKNRALNSDKTRDNSIEFMNYNYRPWTIQDAKDGDVLATENFIFVFKNIDNGNGVHYYCHYEISKHEDDNQFDVALPQSLMGRVGNSISHYSPATKEQCDQLEKAMADAGYIFDFEKKELKKIKQEWSEEDIVAIDCAVEVLSKNLPSLAASIAQLKSLRPQSQWKPSEEQMKTLNEVINYCANGKEAYLNDYIYNRLIDLRDELNKL